MDNKERRKESNMPGIHTRGKHKERDKEGGRWRKEVEAEPSLEGVNKRERESEKDREIEIVGG